MKTARFFAMLALLGVLLANPWVAFAAGQLKGLSDTLSDPRPGEDTNHTFRFTTATAATLKAFQFNFCQESSGGCTVPTGLTTQNAAGGFTFDDTFVTGLGTGSLWDNTSSTGEQNARIQHDGPGFGTVGDTPVAIRLGNITNFTLGDECDGDGDNSSDTCFVQINTYNHTTFAAGTIVDQGIATFTVVNAVTVSARIDPTFTFVLSGTGASTAYNGITTSVATDENTIAFGNMAVGTPKYAAQSLTVITNTQSGYTVSVRALAPSAGLGSLQGVYTTNHVDDFIAPWTTPTTWTEPTGVSPNAETAWFGANTTDNDVAGWEGADSGKFGGVGQTNVVVMSKDSSDNGENPVYVTYALEANVFQPADTYTGTLVYTAVPTY